MQYFNIAPYNISSYAWIDQRRVRTFFAVYAHGLLLYFCMSMLYIPVSLLSISWLDASIGWPTYLMCIFAFLYPFCFAYFFAHFKVQYQKTLREKYRLLGGGYGGLSLGFIFFFTGVHYGYVWLEFYGYLMIFFLLIFFVIFFAYCLAYMTYFTYKRNSKVQCITKWEKKFVNYKEINALVERRCFSFEKYGGVFFGIVTMLAAIYYVYDYENAIFAVLGSFSIFLGLIFFFKGVRYFCILYILILPVEKHGTLVISDAFRLSLMRPVRYYTVFAELQKLKGGIQE